jgi:hypothetical protein
MSLKTAAFFKVTKVARRLFRESRYYTDYLHVVCVYWTLQKVINMAMPAVEAQ